MKKRFWNTEKLMSFLAIILSVGTLAVFIYQTNLIKKQQYASVYPYLEMGFHGRGTEQMKFVLSNEGVGPAMIKSVQIRRKGVVYEGRFSGFLREMTEIEKGDSIQYLYSDIVEGKMVAVGAHLDLIDCRNAYTSDRISELINEYEMEIEIEYESIYGERWRIGGGNRVPKKIK